MNNIKQIEVIYYNHLVGRLALTKEGLCAFEYSSEWLSSGFSISPFELPLRNGVFIAKPHPFDGGFGVFNDCLPDGWGLLILDRHLQRKGILPRTLTILDRLALVGSNGRGALEFRPDRSVISPQEYADFENLSVEAEKIFDNDDYMGEGIEEFQYRGGSPGGARPKIFTHYDGKEWLVKFRAKHDPKNIGINEYKYSLLAKKCGIEMPETRLFENKFFGVERFDRSPKGKLHVISIAGLINGTGLQLLNSLALGIGCQGGSLGIPLGNSATVGHHAIVFTQLIAGLINADYRIPCIDYTQIFQVCAILTHNIAELWKIFRLMVFNYLIENKDDHAKNFAFIYDNGNWRFSPAYDLLPSDGMNGFHTTSINNSIEPTKEDIITVATKAGLNKKEAEKTFENIHDIIQKHSF